MLLAPQFEDLRPPRSPDSLLEMQSLGPPPTLDFLNQILWRWGPVVCALPSPLSSLGTAEQKHCLSTLTFLQITWDLAKLDSASGLSGAWDSALLISSQRLPGLLAHRQYTEEQEITWGAQFKCRIPAPLPDSAILQARSGAQPREFPQTPPMTLRQVAWGPRLRIPSLAFRLADIHPSLIFKGFPPLLPISTGLEPPI